MGGEAGRAPSLADIRRGSYDSSERRSSVGDKGRRLSRVGSGISGVGKRRKSGGIVEEEECVKAFGKTEDGGQRKKQNGDHVDTVEEEEKISAEDTSCIEPVPPIDDAEDEDNGYVPPPKLPWTTATVVGLKGFWKWFLTPLGFLVTIYSLNVVAWGGMLFLLLCNAAPAMCHPTCNDLHSARRIWIEIDSQILTGLFCVTGFGLIPWRFRTFMRVRWNSLTAIVVTSSWQTKPVNRHLHSLRNWRSSTVHLQLELRRRIIRQWR